MTNQLEFTQEFWDKIYNYCLMHAKTRLRTHKGNCEFIAEEATSMIMSRFFRHPLDKKRMNDRFYFITARNTVITVLKRELNTKVREVFNDYNNISLDVDLEGDITFEIEYEDTIEEKIKEEEEVNAKIKLIVDTIENKNYLTDEDTSVFVERYLNNKTVIETAEYLGLPLTRVRSSGYRIRNVLNHLQNERDNL